MTREERVQAEAQAREAAAKALDTFVAQHGKPPTIEDARSKLLSVGIYFAELAALNDNRDFLDNAIKAISAANELHCGLPRAARTAPRSGPVSPGSATMEARQDPECPDKTNVYAGERLMATLVTSIGGGEDSVGSAGVGR